MVSSNNDCFIAENKLSLYSTPLSVALLVHRVIAASVNYLLFNPVQFYSSCKQENYL